MTACPLNAWVSKAVLARGRVLSKSDYREKFAYCSLATAKAPPAMAERLAMDHDILDTLRLWRTSLSRVPGLEVSESSVEFWLDRSRQPWRRPLKRSP